MFQNINEDTINAGDYEEVKKEKKKIDIFSNVFSIRNIIISIISLMVSMVGINGDLSPFSISILGACLSNSIPILGIVVAGIIGNMVKFGVSGALRIYFNDISNNCNIICNKT